MSMDESEQPKIIVDSDWKQEAQAEKQRLAEQEQKLEEAKAQAGEAGDPNRPIDFHDIVRLLATQSLMYLGAFPDPQTGQAMLAPELAKAHIDMLGVLEAKTAGNLAEDEAKELSAVLNELRLQYVEVSKAVAKAVAEGKIKPQPGGGMVPTMPPPPPVS